MRNSRPTFAALGAAALAALFATGALAQPVSQPEKAKKGRSSDAGAADTGTAATSVTRPDSASKSAPLRLRAIAFDPNNPGVGSSTRTLDIVIERWSSDTERDQLRGVLQEKGGGDELLKAVQKIKPRAGYVRTTQSLGWDLQFAREATLPDGTRRIVLGSDRPLSFWEASNHPRSADYEFMLADIRIDKDGKGQGRLAPAAMVDWDESTKTIEIENFEAQPVRLTEVTILK